MPKHLILFLAADPSDIDRLALADECAAIGRELRMAPDRDGFELCSRWAVTVDELMRHLVELQPTIIHFSGCGAAGEPAPASDREIALPDSGDRHTGIYLQGERGGAQLITPRALTMMIRSAAPSVRVLVLNGCYSEAHADAVRGAVDCVVGMTGAVQAAATHSFAVGFYRALGNCRSVGNAVEQAVATLAAKQVPDELLPRCRARDGVDANQLVL